jgi:hypothetical protein
VEDRNPDAQRAVRQNELFHIPRRADEVTLAAKTCFEFLPETLEQVNVLRFLSCEPE